MAERSWTVYAGDRAVLEISDRAGPLRSTAPPPPEPVLHPFLSATALDASVEHELQQLLETSREVEGFLRALEAAGYRVVATAP